jgi:hypothetical protein
VGSRGRGHHPRPRGLCGDNRRADLGEPAPSRRDSAHLLDAAEGTAGLVRREGLLPPVAVPRSGFPGRGPDAGTQEGGFRTPAGTAGPARGADAGGIVLLATAVTHDAAVLPAVARLAEAPGVSEHPARVIIAGTGLDASRFPASGHLVSWAGLVPVAAQSGTRASRDERHGDSYARNEATKAANGAAKSQSVPGERYQRGNRRRGKARGQVTVARSVPVIIWPLLAGRTARYTGRSHDITHTPRHLTLPPAQPTAMA